MNCVTVVNRSKVKIEENGRKVIILNESKESIQKIEVDGCLIGDGRRCDWAVVDKDGDMALIELKGRDVAHACDQLFSTINHSAVRSHIKAGVGFLIVCSRWPRFDTTVAKAKTRASREFKAGFHVVKNQCETTVKRIVSIKGT